MEEETKLPLKSIIVSEMTLARSLHVWMANFADNLPIIKKSSDIRDMDCIGGPAIVVGAGPSIHKFNQLEMLAKSNFKGVVISTDRMLIPCLKAGVTPKYVLCVDGYLECSRYFMHDLVKQNSDKIIGVFSTFVHPAVLKSFEGKKYFFHTWMDDPKKPDSITRAIHFMSKNTILSCSGDVGSTCWKSAVGLDCNPIALIGMDYSEENLEDLPDYQQMVERVPERLMHRSGDTIELEHAETGEKLEAFRKDHNPDTNTDAWTGMVWDSCWEVFKQWIKIEKDRNNRITYNCTGGGVIHSADVISVPFNEFLERFSKNHMEVIK